LSLRFFDCTVKALDFCNIARDGLDLVRQWRNPTSRHLSIVQDVVKIQST
jgi:hypothetical protein